MTVENRNIFPKFYGIHEVSEILDIPVGTLYNMNWKGTLPCCKVGKRIKMTEEHINLLINKSGSLYESEV